jgi:hypothetical protein
MIELLAAFVIIICNPDDTKQCRPSEKDDPRYATHQKCEDARKRFEEVWQMQIGEYPPPPNKCKDESEQM